MITAWFAWRAFRKQSQEVSDQATILKVQADRLDAQREQLREQQALSAKQTEVLKLQSHELRESLEERQREREQRKRSQASRFFISQHFEDEPETVEHCVIAAGPDLPSHDTCQDESVAKEWIFIELRVHNTSDEPVYDLATRWRSGTAEWHGPNHEAVLLPGAEVLYLRNVRVSA